MMRRIVPISLILVFHIFYVGSQSLLFAQNQRISMDTAICAGESVQLNVSGGLLYQWSPATGLNNDTIPNPVATPTQTTMYVVTKLVPDPSLEEIVNGDFESGNTGFNSDYIFKSPGSGVYIEGEYTISDNPTNEHFQFSPCPDHTSGSGMMMVVNGDSVENVTVWEQSISVTPDSIYAFSCWLQTVSDPPDANPNPAILQFWVNGVLLGEPFMATEDTCNWQQFYELWNADTNNRAVIRIVNQNPEKGGNDFALDDISFAPLRPVYDTFLITVYDYPVINWPEDTLVPYGNSITLNAGNPGASYSWTTGQSTQTITIGSVTKVYNIGVYVEMNGCETYDEIRVDVSCNLGVPSGFSPNGDGQNDVLYVYGDGFGDLDLKIFNRLGEMVFQTSDASQGWDGTCRGKEQPVDVYMYYLEAYCFSGGYIERKGNVTLLR